MADAKFVSSDKHLQQALEEVRQSREEAERFAADPEGYLKDKGVKTEGLHFGPPPAAGGELSEADLEHVAGGSISICASVGCFACVTVGGDLF